MMSEQKPLNHSSKLAILSGDFRTISTQNSNPNYRLVRVLDEEPIIKETDLLHFLSSEGQSLYKNPSDG